MLKFVDGLVHYICLRYINSTYVSKFQVNTITNIEVIRQNVFSHARVIVIGVSSDLKNKLVAVAKQTGSWFYLVKIPVERFSYEDKLSYDS